MADKEDGDAVGKKDDVAGMEEEVVAGKEADDVVVKAGGMTGEEDVEDTDAAGKAEAEDEDVVGKEAVS